MRASARLAGVAAGVVGLLMSGSAAQGVVPGPELEYEWETGTAGTVYDGDTLDVRILTSNSGYTGTQRVRTIGVQAPEVAHNGTPAQCGAAQARDALRALAPVGTPIQLRALSGSSYDDYSGGRLVRSIYAQDEEGNWFDTARQLVSNGTLLWFPLADTSDKKPEWAHNLEYRVLADDAATDRRGLWTPDLCGPSPSAGAPLRMWVAYDNNGSYEKAWIANDGGADVPIGGWTFRDSALNRYTFPAGAYVPASGSVEVRLTSGTTTSPTGPFYVNSSTWFVNLPAENSSFVGDAAYLMDNAGPFETGNLRTWYAYPCNPDTCNDPAVNPLRGQVGIESIRPNDPARTAPSKPGAVVAQAATDGSGSVTVSWTASADIGGPATELTYTVEAQRTGPDPAPQSAGTATSHVFTGLEPGVSHTFRVRATNPQGTATSDFTTPVVPVTRPGTPTGLTVEPRDGRLVASWTPPESDGFRQISGYEVVAGIAGVGPVATATTAGAVTSLAVPSLINGQPYDVQVRALNGAAGELSAPVSATPATYVANPAPTLPGPPIETVVRSSSATGVIVSWKAPTSDGGAQITRYSVRNTAGPGSFECVTDDAVAPGTSGVTSCAIGGLAAGESYSFAVRAYNSQGQGPESTPSTALTPAAYPERPLGPTAPTSNYYVDEPWQANEQIVLKNLGSNAVRLDGHALYDKDARTGDDGRVFDSPDFIFPPGTTIPAGGTLRVLTGADLTPQSTDPDKPLFMGRSNFLNNDGDRVELAALTKSLVTCQSFGTATCAGQAPTSTPTQPVGITARTTPSSVTVYWGAPVSRGGTAITGYAVTAYDAANGGNVVGSCATDGSGRSCSFPGAIGARYYVEVTATNAVGTSAPSAPRALAAPRTVPSAPGGVTTTSTTGGAIVTWSPSAENGAPITQYTAWAYAAPTGGKAVASCTATGGATTCTLSGLKQGTPYFVDVTATNRAGASAPSSPRVPTTTAGAPSAISTYSKGKVTVRWDPPIAGSTAITGYQAKLYTKASGGKLVGSCKAAAGKTKCTTKKMKKRSKYYIDLTTYMTTGSFTVKPRIVTGPAKKASAPKITSATTSGKRVVIAWAPPTFNGYSYLKGYGARLYTKSKGGSVKATCSSKPAVTTCTTKSMKKRTYYASVRVKNSKGWSSWSKRVKVVVR